MCPCDVACMIVRLLENNMQSFFRVFRVFCGFLSPLAVLFSRISCISWFLIHSGSLFSVFSVCFPARCARAHILLVSNPHAVLRAAPPRPLNRGAATLWFQLNSVALFYCNVKVMRDTVRTNDMGAWWAKLRGSNQTSTI